MRRKYPVTAGEIYHICNKSIGGYRIFGSNKNAVRFIHTLEYYNSQLQRTKYSRYLISNYYQYDNLLNTKPDSCCRILSFCIMPDHYHLLVRPITGIFSAYLSKVENSYSKFFNTKYKRHGPLWQSRFRSVHIGNDSLLLHVCRYIHLNPTTSKLVQKPEDWMHSSYRDFIFRNYSERISQIGMRPNTYREFCNDQIDYQRSLKRIKKLLLE